MLMIVLSQLSVWGLKYHGKKSDQYDTTTKKFAYHVYMANLYLKILRTCVESNRLRDKYLK